VGLLVVNCDSGIALLVANTAILYPRVANRIMRRTPAGLFVRTQADARPGVLPDQRTADCEHNFDNRTKFDPAAFACAAIMSIELPVKRPGPQLDSGVGDRFESRSLFFAENINAGKSRSGAVFDLAREWKGSRSLPP